MLNTILNNLKTLITTTTLDDLTSGITVLFIGAIIIALCLYKNKKEDEKQYKNVWSKQFRFIHNYAPIPLFVLFVLVFCTHNLVTFSYGILLAITSFIIYYYNINFDTWPRFFKPLYIIICYLTVEAFVNANGWYLSFYRLLPLLGMMFGVVVFGRLFIGSLSGYKYLFGFSWMMFWAVGDFENFSVFFFIELVMLGGLKLLKMFYKHKRLAMFDRPFETPLAASIMLSVPVSLLLIGTSAWLANPVFIH